MHGHIRSLSDGERAILSQDGDEPHDGPRIFETRTHVAQKAYPCDTCGMGGIAPGETYTRVVMLGDDGFQIRRFCTNPTPPTETGNWHCESERLQFVEHQRALYVGHLIEDGAMSEEAASALFDLHRKHEATAKAEREAAETARRAVQAARPNDPNADDLPF